MWTATVHICLGLEKDDRHCNIHKSYLKNASTLVQPKITLSSTMSKVPIYVLLVPPWHKLYPVTLYGEPISRYLI